MTTVIVGATRGLGKALSQYYISKGSKVYGTTRKHDSSGESISGLNWITGVDIGTPAAGKAVIDGYGEKNPIGTLIVSAGFFGKETFDEPDWEAEHKMYLTSSIGPVFLVQALVKAELLKSGSKVVMVSSEAGSISLRHKKEGGGNYGHHASKAALNMSMKLLSLDLEHLDITVVSVHPGFMKTEMTKNVGYDQFWESGGAVDPSVAAKSLGDWIDGSLDMSKSGQFWAPRGPADIGTADVVIGPKDKLPTPLQLPW